MLLPIAVIRQGKPSPLVGLDQPKSGELAFFAVHGAKAPAARAWLESAGFAVLGEG